MISTSKVQVDAPLSQPQYDGAVRTLDCHGWPRSSECDPISLLGLMWGDTGVEVSSCELTAPISIADLASPSALITIVRFS